MATAKDKDDTQSVLTTDHGAAGGMEVDGKGNRVWRWAREVLDSTSVLLKRLENKDLALDPTAKVPVMRGPKDAKTPAQDKKKARAPLSISPEPGGRDSVGGFDPYNSKR
jgi:hypothetical protein